MWQFSLKCHGGKVMQSWNCGTLVFQVMPLSMHAFNNHSWLKGNGIQSMFLRLPKSPSLRLILLWNYSAEKLGCPVSCGRVAIQLLALTYALAILLRA